MNNLDDHTDFCLIPSLTFDYQTDEHFVSLDFTYSKDELILAEIWINSMIYGACFLDVPDDVLKGDLRHHINNLSVDIWLMEFLLKQGSNFATIATEVFKYQYREKRLKQILD